MWKKRKSSTTFTFNGEKVFLAASQTLGTVFSYFHTSRIGLTQEEVEKIFYKNVLRVYKSVL